MKSSSRSVSAFASVALLALLALFAAGPLSGAVLIQIFNDDFGDGGFVGWSDKFPAECTDGIRNGTETDIDCGGLACDACQPGDSCLVDDDCADLPAWTQAYPSCDTGICTMGCSGENYDVNDNIADGCEVVDAPQGNHSQATAPNVGSQNCFDAFLQFMGKLPSDERDHAFPPVGGFDSQTGMAPDYLLLDATGGVGCTNDLSITLSTSGGSPSGLCYRLSIITTVATYSCNVAGSGSCPVTCPSSCYGDGTAIYFKVEKTCILPLTENVSYTISGHI